MSYNILGIEFHALWQDSKHAVNCCFLTSAAARYLCCTQLFNDFIQINYSFVYVELLYNTAQPLDSVSQHDTLWPAFPFNSALVMAQYTNVEFWIVDISAVPFRSAAYFVYVTTKILSQYWALNDALLSNWHYWILIQRSIYFRWIWLSVVV